jgi:hypothetical protein
LTSLPSQIPEVILSTLTTEGSILIGKCTHLIVAILRMKDMVWQEENAFRYLEQFQGITSDESTALLASLHLQILNRFQRENYTLQMVLNHQLWKNYFYFCAKWNIRIDYPGDLTGDWNLLHAIISKPYQIIRQTVDKLKAERIAVSELEYLLRCEDNFLEFVAACQWSKAEISGLLKKFAKALQEFDNRTNLMTSFKSVWIANLDRTITTQPFDENLQFRQSRDNLTMKQIQVGLLIHNHSPYFRTLPLNHFNW